MDHETSQDSALHQSNSNTNVHPLDCGSLYEYMFHNAPVGFVALSKDLVILEANQTLGKILETNAHTLIGRPFLDLINPNDRENCQRWLSRELYTLESHIELKIQPTNASAIDIIIRERATNTSSENLRPLRDLRLLSIADIRDRKQVELNLIQAKHTAENADKVKTDFLARVSHELRTPLNAIIGFTDLLLLNEDSLNDNQHESLDFIKSNSHYLLNLVNDLLEISTPSAHELQLELQDVTIISIVRDTVNMIQPLADKHSVTIHDPPDIDATIQADPTRLRQVLINLLANAIKYNKTNGTVSFNLSVNSSGFYRLDIIDTGPGISESNQAKIFEPFFRVESEFNPKSESTGIGLTICKQLVTLMGGQIGVRSQSGKGTTFWIEFPAAESTFIASDQPSTILYIEDNPANLYFLQQLFQQYPQFDLLSAQETETGLKLASQQQPNLILMDIELPHMNGYEALAHLRIAPTTKHIPVLALSAHALPEQIQKGLDAGFDAYLIKPIEINTLMDTIKTHLEKSKRMKNINTVTKD
ncbi:MAG: ATP-binding protein [Gammaproteobacteria bacterium]|nr:ATP-binding protein [Gammaproteobacteria bacterium]